MLALNFKLIERIKKHEGLRLKPYLCPAGKLTIGYGRNLEDRGITEIEANQMLLNDLKQIEFEFDIRGFYLSTHPQNVQEVLYEMAFQMGVNGLFKFKKTLEYIRNVDYLKASVEMLDSKWAKQTPKRAKELSNLMKGGI